jgi:hypothetical protein
MHTSLYYHRCAIVQLQNYRRFLDHQFYHLTKKISTRHAVDDDVQLVNEMKGIIAN